MICNFPTLNYFLVLKNNVDLPLRRYLLYCMVLMTPVLVLLHPTESSSTTEATDISILFKTQSVNSSKQDLEQSLKHIQ